MITQHENEILDGRQKSFRKLYRKRVDPVSRGLTQKEERE